MTDGNQNVLRHARDTAVAAAGSAGILPARIAVIHMPLLTELGLGGKLVTIHMSPLTGLSALPGRMPVAFNGWRFSGTRF